MDSALPSDVVIKIEPKGSCDELFCSPSFSSDVDPWAISPNADMLADEVEKENMAGFEVTPQPALPSPDRHSNCGEAVGQMGAYLAHDNEQNSSLDLLGQLEGLNSSDSSDICLGTVSFADLLDIDYNEHGTEGDLVSELDEKLKRLDKETPTELSPSAEQGVLKFKGRYCLRERKHAGVEDRSNSASDGNVLQRKPKQTNASKTIVLNQKDGTRKVLNVVPVTTGEEKRAMHFSITSTTSLGSCTSSSVTCGSTKSMPAQVASSMYPDSTELPEDKSRRNAIQAKINREKKKAYIASLEKQVSELSRDRSRLECQTARLQKERDMLAEEVTYLRSVIANQSTLSKLLNGIPDVRGVSLTSSFSKEKRSFAEDHDYGQAPSKRRRTPAEQISGGVCLHVENENVSLEFCSSCARMAKGAARSEVS